MANEFRIKNGFRSEGNSDITGSLTVTSGITGSISTASFASTSSYTIDQGAYYAGLLSGSGTWSQLGNGTITLPTANVALYDNANNFAPLKIYTVTGGTTGTEFPALVNNDTNYVFIKYNSGSPIWDVDQTGALVNGSDTVLVYIVYRANNFVHVLDFGNEGAGLPNKISARLRGTQRFGRESGLSLGLSGSDGIVTLTSGVLWNDTNRQTIAAVNSQDDIFFKNYHSASVWTYTTSGNFINNGYYDTGITTASVDPGKYLTNWYYRGQEVNDHLYEVFSQAQYDSVASAQLATEPSLPELISSHAVLVGRIIIQSGSVTGSVESAFTTVFQATNVTAHNDTTGIQGGTAGQYYHLTANQYNNIALTNTNNNFSTSQTFNSDVIITGSVNVTGSQVALDIDKFQVNLPSIIGYPTVIQASTSGIILADNTGTTALDTSTRTLEDNVDNVSVNFNNRQLIKSDGTTVAFDWENAIITASLHGTASYATQALSASWAPSGITIDNNVDDYLVTATGINKLNGETNLRFDGTTLKVIGNIQASSISGSLTGSLVGTASTASFVTASNVYGPYGSNSVISASFALSASWAPGSGGGATFVGGTNVDNRIITSTGTTPELNGEANLTFNGSTLAVTGNVTANSFTGSLQGTATTASYVQTAQTASYVQNAVSASFATTASYVTGSIFTNTNPALSASYALTSSFALSASWAPGSGVTINNNTDNYLITATGIAATLNGEANATFNGSTLTVAGDILVTSSLTIGSSSLGSGENTLVVGPPPNGGTGEGGQILLQAVGGTYTSASMLDVYQDKFRVLRGTNAGSDAYKMQINLHTGQVQIPNYNSPTAFTGSEVANLGVDSSGNIITSPPATGIGDVIAITQIMYPFSGF